jgi:hypothetical protein
VPHDHHAGREEVLDALRAELLGPAPFGEPLEVSLSGATFATLKESYGSHVEQGTGEEVLGWDRPLQRYGVGVLFPASLSARQARASDPADELPALSKSADPDEVQDEDSDGMPSDDVAAAADDLVEQSAVRQLAQLGKRLGNISSQSDSDGSDSDGSEELNLAGANLRKPCTLGISFGVHLPPGTDLVVEAAGGRYRYIEATVREDGRKRRIYVRASWRLRAEFSSGQLHAKLRRRCQPDVTDAEGLGDIPQGGGKLDLQVEAYARPMEGGILVTVTLLNLSKGTMSGAGAREDTRCVFQVQAAVRVQGDGARVLPYPRSPHAVRDPEEESFDLLYRDQPVFAVGHGCAADWSAEGDQITEVRAEALPTYETPSITPDVTRPDGTTLSVAIAPLAGYVEGDDGMSSLKELVDLYEDWIAARREDAVDLADEHRKTAAAHLDRCAAAAARMRVGLSLLESDPQARRAFQLANAAVLLQQLRSVTGTRQVTGVDRARGALTFSPEWAPIDPRAPSERRGRWRAFQIAFLLMSIASTADGSDEDRDVVELIWFPTGGGKTEAYLGLTAFSLFLRRLRNPDDVGVDVLMRYTLRLLTAQQFQRAARLICAMEVLRADTDDLGTAPFSIGIWVGGSTTPNKHKQARKALSDLQKGTSDRNPFLLTSCPWCGAQMGLSDQVRASKGKSKGASVPRLLGVRRAGEEVVLHCPDAACEFSLMLPVHVVDEAVYSHRPSLVIGTVDKFAMMAWLEEPRGLFGLAPDGTREASPPNLIIQDELHLISGPLGSLVGLYEMVIEELSTDRRGGRDVRPKLVTSTATIRRFDEQVRALYARDRVELFPAPGLDAGDSFFSTYARDASGKLLPGRRYVGVHATNHTSLITTQVNAMAALLQAPMEMPDAGRDPWWTQLVFFNNLRELGSSLSLVASNVPMQVRSIGDRTGHDLDGMRRVREVMELTSRLQSHEVPTAIQRLEVEVEDGNYPVDVCLASNIIEVGIDIDRLSLMVIVGQPKTTSQYIQVSGRIGRRWQERPGLVVTLLNPGRPRDRSHFEQFRAYHQRLYAQVEPTSVTPFSPPALDRALHGALVAYLRQRVDTTRVNGPSDVPQELLDEFSDLATARVATVDPSEGDVLRRLLDKRFSQMDGWGRMRWDSPFGGEEVGLLSNPGLDASHVPDAWTWPTPTSMRTVDAECEVDVTKHYAQEALENTR